MTKFLELAYYNNRGFIFPKYLEPTTGPSLVGIQTDYIDLSDSKYGGEVFRKSAMNVTLLMKCLLIIGYLEITLVQ